MTEIKDLEWKKRRAVSSEQALAHFPNGYTASVLRGGFAWTDGGTYEMAVLRDGYLDYTTPVTNDVLKCLSEEEANHALRQIENLPNPDGGE